jgi:hypothetical protein
MQQTKIHKAHLLILVNENFSIGQTLEVSFDIPICKGIIKETLNLQLAGNF